MQLPDIRLPDARVIPPAGVDGGAASEPGRGSAVPPVLVPVVVPPLVVPPPAAVTGEPGGDPAQNAPSPRPDVTPTLKQLEPAAAEPPASGLGAARPPASFRVGYNEYLRAAGMFEILALALPGLAGILGLMGLGGLLGYRHAKAGQLVRTGPARFMR